jgi:hypothetical protein
MANPARRFPAPWSNMTVEFFDRKEFPSFGKCIYCGATASETELTDEHVVPLSFGGNVIIRGGSCITCATETGKIEQEIGRKAWWDFRTHSNAPTRRPKERPTELSFYVSISGGNFEKRTVPVDEHPFFTPMPTWGPPGLLRDAAPSTEFPSSKARVFYWIPPEVRKLWNIPDGASINIRVPDFRFDQHKFARVIAKIAYCQTVLHHGLHGFRRLVTPDLILGRYPYVPYFVGTDPDIPLPPGDRKLKHSIQILTSDAQPFRLISVAVRLFANTGTNELGPPTYRVIVGAQLPHGGPTKSPFRKHSLNQKFVKIFLPGL